MGGLFNAYSSMAQTQMQMQEMQWQMQMWRFGIAIAILGAVAAMIPRIIKWVKHNHCPRCHSWFTLQFVRFDVDKTITGHDKQKNHSGYRPGWRGGFTGGSSWTNDQPFIREFGKGRYLCTKCNLHLTIEESRDRR
jgi:hypothetical protein